MIFGYPVSIAIVSQSQDTPLKNKPQLVRYSSIACG